jgi:hypothetical protein
MIKVVVISHNQPESVDRLYGQLSKGFDDVEVWDTASDPDKVPINITISDENVSWEGVWAKAMQIYGDYDALWILGGDISLENDASEYAEAIESAMEFGCWSPAIRGRAHPFMLADSYGDEMVSVRNIEGMALAVSGELIRRIGGKFEVSTEIGFGQDYWLCHAARKNGMRNIIDGRVTVNHPPGIGYDEGAAHDAMERVFSERYGADFRRTVFEYDQTYEGNLVKEERKMLTIITVENGWGVPEIEAIMKEVEGVELVVMQKGVSNFDVEGATVLPYTTDLDDLIARADLALFARVGPANEKEYAKILEAGVPMVVHNYYHQGKIEHEVNGFVYGHESWAIQWLNTLVKDEGARKRVSAAWTEETPAEVPEEVVAMVEELNAEVEAGQTVLMDIAMKEKPLDDGEVLVTVITPTYKRDSGVIRRSYDCLKLQSVAQWEQLICSDGGDEEHVRKLVEDIGDERVSYHHLDAKKDGDYGNTCRAEMLKRARGRYVLFLDDDNVILPKYLEIMIGALGDSGKDFAVCDVMHFGPLNEAVAGKPPVVLTGEPVKLYSVDPLQILVKREAMQDVGWDVDRGYIADGVSLEALGDKYEYVKVPEVLGVHI